MPESLPDELINVIPKNTEVRCKVLSCETKISKGSGVEYIRPLFKVVEGQYTTKPAFACMLAQEWMIRPASIALATGLAAIEAGEIVWLQAVRENPDRPRSYNYMKLAKALVGRVLMVKVKVETENEFHPEQNTAVSFKKALDENGLPVDQPELPDLEEPPIPDVPEAELGPDTEIPGV